MARTKTVTPLTENRTHSITFPSAKIAEFGRVDPASGWITFHCALPKGFEALFTLLGWDVPGDKTISESLEGKLEDGTLVLTSKDKLIDAEVSIDFKTITAFACKRLELEGRKGKGFRRELRFKATFKHVDGCALLEGYMMRCDNARGSLKVTYLEQPVQTEIPHDEEQLEIKGGESKPPMTDTEYEAIKQRGKPRKDTES